jgi:hypothetical protein
MPGARLSDACFFSVVWDLPLKGLLIIPSDPLSRKNQKVIIKKDGCKIPVDIIEKTYYFLFRESDSVLSV